MGRIGRRPGLGAGPPATLDPGAADSPVGAHPAVGEAPAVARPHQFVAVPAPVVDTPVGYSKEVAAGPGPIGRLRLDQHVAHVVPDSGRAGAGGYVATGAGHEGPDRVPTPVGWLALDLDDAVGGEQRDEVVDAAAVDAVRVAGDRVPDLLARLELHQLSPLSPSQAPALPGRSAKPPPRQPRARSLG